MNNLLSQKPSCMDSVQDAGKREGTVHVEG